MLETQKNGFVSTVTLWITLNKTNLNLTFQIHKSQAEEIKSSLKQKGIPVTVKPVDWIEAVELLYTAGHHGTMQTIV